MESDLNASIDNLFDSQVFTTHAGALPRPVHVSPLVGQRYLGATLTPFRFEARLGARVDAIPPLFGVKKARALSLSDPMLVGNLVNISITASVLSGL